MEAHDRQTEGFSRPIDSYTDEELRGMWYVTGWMLSALPRMIDKILHPKHTPKIRKAIAYLTALRELQLEAWEAEFEKIRQDNNVLAMLERGEITKDQYINYILNGHTT